jgi:AcrR family transcriptional regulator
MRLEWDAVPADGPRRTEILETAARLFASSGMRTSLQQIAEACGILPGSLYHHFASKEAIVVELLERYRADLDDVADHARVVAVADADVPPVAEQIMTLGSAIAACAGRHRAAVIQSFYEPPTAAGDRLVKAAERSPLAIEAAMLELLQAGRKSGYIRKGIDLPTLAERLCTTMLSVSLGVFPDQRGADAVPAVRLKILLDGVATAPPPNDELDRSAASLAARDVVASWEKDEADEDDRLVQLRAAARTEFGRRGYETTTVRDIAAASGLSTGTVYRLVGSKDELLTSIMGSFPAKVREGWTSVLRSDATAVEKLDALMWIDINVVDRFSDEYNIQLAWLRESPPTTTDYGQNFATFFRDLKALLAAGTTSGELRVEGPSADIRAWSLFDPMWMHESIVRRLGVQGSLALARATVLRGATQRP